MTNKTKLVNVKCAWIISLFVFLFFPARVFAVNLLKNPGFEEGIKDWSFTPSTATFSATTTFKHSGDYGVILTKENASSWAYFKQEVPIEADKYYRMSGWVLLNDAVINNVKLRFYWLDASEAKISATPVETTLSSKDSSFQFLQTEIFTAPSNTQFVDIQGYVNLDQKNPSNPAVFDELVFEDVPSPTSTPTSSPTSTPEPTATPRPTSVPTPVPTSTPIPTPTIKPSLIPTKTPTPSLSLTLTPTGEILGEETASAEGQLNVNENDLQPTIKAEIKKLSLGSKNKYSWLFPLVVIGGGLGLVSFSVYSLLKPPKL